MGTSYWSDKRIAIIGAGPGGMMLSLILQRHGISSVIYERELSLSARQQGGSLDIHHDSGQRALQEAGLYEQFQALARYEGEDFRLLDKKGYIYLDEIADPDHPGTRPEIDREALCRLLLDALPPGTIQWGYRLVQTVSLEDHTWELDFENGKKANADLVVGADGAFSHIRSLLTDAQPKYSGISMIEIWLNDAVHQYPEIAAFNRQGKLFALGDHRGIIAQLNGDGRIRVYLSFRVEKEWLDHSGITFDQPQQAKQQLLAYFKDWSTELQQYIRSADGEILPRRIYMLPVGLVWESRTGVTLIGDAAHLMSPFAGEGVNMALRDAMELALSITRREDMDKAVQEYEHTMYAYSAVLARESDNNLKLCFDDCAAERLYEVMNGYQEQENSTN